MANVLDMSSVDRFQAVIRRIAATTTREPAEVVKQAYIHLIQSGRAGTKLSKTRREIVPNPEHVRGAKGDKYLILAYRPDGTINRIPTDSRSDKRRKISRRGLAKASWNWMLSGLKPPQAGDEKAGGGIRKTSIAWVINGLARRERPSIMYANRLRYLEIANPGIYERALAKATNRMEKLLKIGVRSKYEKAWD